MTTEIRLQQIEHPEVYNRYRWVASYENGLTCGCFDGHKSPEAATACFRKRLGLKNDKASTLRNQLVRSLRELGGPGAPWDYWAITE